MARPPLPGGWFDTDVPRIWHIRDSLSGQP